MMTYIRSESEWSVVEVEVSSDENIYQRRTHFRVVLD